jgi:hypothetical protein
VGLDNTTIRALAPSPAFGSDRTMFAGADGDVFLSTDAGDTWRPISEGLDHTSVFALKASPFFEEDRVLFAGTGGGALRLALAYGICGDQNGDGVADIEDVMIDLQVIVGAIAPTSAQMTLSDLDRSGAINIIDAIIGMQHVAGQIPTLDECGPREPG